MKIKRSVEIYGLHEKMQKVLNTVEEIWDDYGQEAVITAGRDGTHKKNSLHYSGKALDFRIRYFADELHEEIAERLSEELGDAFDVVLHSTHIHVEYDPR